MSKRFSHSSSVSVRGGSLHRRGRGETEFIRQVCSLKRREELHLMGELDVVNQRVTGSSGRRTRVARGRASGAYRFPFISCLHWRSISTRLVKGKKKQQLRCTTIEWIKPFQKSCREFRFLHRYFVGWWQWEDYSDGFRMILERNKIPKGIHFHRRSNTFWHRYIATLSYSPARLL